MSSEFNGIQLSTKGLLKELLDPKKAMFRLIEKSACYEPYFFSMISDFVLHRFMP